LAREVRRARALTAATRSLAASDRSARALEQRLARAGHSAAAREDAIASLARAGALDDARLAENRAETLARRGYGDAAIRADLRRRLIAPEAAADAVADLEPEAVRLRRVLENESVTPALLRRLAGRGFSRDSLDEVGSSFASEP
jgi:SOS response regulatory protein OraA/RecX